MEVRLYGFLAPQVQHHCQQSPIQRNHRTESRQEYHTKMIKASLGLVFNTDMKAENNVETYKQMRVLPRED